MSLVSEFRRRNVLRMAVLYVVAAWLIMQVVEVMMSLVGLPENKSDTFSKVLQLICFNNPVVNEWQPLPETCEEVVEQHRL
jgi:hypothetical protein